MEALGQAEVKVEEVQGDDAGAVNAGELYSGGAAADEGGAVKNADRAGGGSLKDVGQAALQRQQQLEEKTLMYMGNPLVASLIFEPTPENHLVEATYTIFRQFILRNEWHVKRIKASEDEKRIYKSAGTSPKYWTYVGRTAQTLKDQLLKGYFVRIPHAPDADYSGQYNAAAAAAAAAAGYSTGAVLGRSGTGAPKSKAVKDPNKPKAKPTPYINFCNAKRLVVKAAHPKASFSELGRIFGIEWAKLDDSEKAQYVSPPSESVAVTGTGSGATTSSASASAAAGASAEAPQFADSAEGTYESEQAAAAAELEGEG